MRPLLIHSLNMIFQQGPAIAITFEFENLNLIKTQLSHAKKFEAKFKGTPDKDLKELLLNFLKNYSEKKHAEISLPLTSVTPFRKTVLKLLQKVKFGETLTYGELADRAGFERAARAVGSACRINPFPLLIPCHRVIANNGKMAGFAFGIDMKEILLDFEGK